MFELEYSKAAVEVLDILDNTSKSDVDKIPLSFINFLVEIASEEYKVNLDHSKPISEMNLNEKTKEILGYIYINWWCNQVDRENYIKQINQLEIKRQEKINEKYNPNKIFENKNKIKEYTNEAKYKTVEKEGNSLTKYNKDESIFKRIWCKILNFLKR